MSSELGIKLINESDTIVHQLNFGEDFSFSQNLYHMSSEIIIYSYTESEIPLPKFNFKIFGSDNNFNGEIEPKRVKCLLDYRPGHRNKNITIIYSAHWHDKHRIKEGSRLKHEDLPVGNYRLVFSCTLIEKEEESDNQYIQRTYEAELPFEVK